MATNDEWNKLNPVTVEEAVSMLPLPDPKLPPITVIGTPEILNTLDAECLKQAINTGMSPGVEEVVINPDAHVGYGAPIGCVMTSSSHIYPGPVGVDIKCSMSLLQLDLPAEAVEDRAVRRRIINAITQRTPTGAGQGQRSVSKSRPVGLELGKRVCVEGATPYVCRQLGIPVEWAERCEDSRHFGHDGTVSALEQRLEEQIRFKTFKDLKEKIQQLGSYGGGNHFGECEIVRVGDEERARRTADVFGLRDGHIAFFSHCGSRGFGHNLAMSEFRSLQQFFTKEGIPFPANDRHLVYAPLGSPQADNYIDDMCLGANFATVNHLLINALVLEAFQEVFPGVNGRLVYFISHNIARQEPLNGRTKWVMRKGATRAFPAKHPGLMNTPFYDTGHPILLPGNPQAGSAVMVADEGALLSCYSVNHGAGRRMGRNQAFKNLDQKSIDQSFDECDILSNCRFYPRDEAPAAYKDFNEVLRSVKSAGLASEVARLHARFVIKDESKADD